MRKSQSRRAAVVLALCHVGVPVAAPDRDMRHQMVQVGFMHHDHARVLNRRIVNEIVIRVVAQMIERDIEFRSVEFLRGGRCRKP